MGSSDQVPGRPGRGEWQGDGALSLDVLLHAVSRRWRLMLACTLVFSVLAAIAAFLMTPKYEAQVVMAPVRSDDGRGLISSALGQLGGLASLAGAGLMGGGGSKDEYLEYLRSRAFAARFIQDENLLPVLFADDWDPAHRKWTVDDPADVPTLADGVRVLDERVRSIQEERRTGIVTLTVVWRDRQLAARWANLMVERANRDLRERAISDAEASVEYLKAEIGKTTVVELRQTLYRVLESQIRTIMLARVREQYAFRVIDPAVAPDADDYVRPKRVAMVLLGAVFGVFVGLVLVLWALRRSRLAAGEQYTTAA